MLCHLGHLKTSFPPIPTLDFFYSFKLKTPGCNKHRQLLKKLSLLKKRCLCCSSLLQHTKPPTSKLQTIKDKTLKSSLFTDRQAAATISIHNSKSQCHSGIGNWSSLYQQKRNTAQEGQRHQPSSRRLPTACLQITVNVHIAVALIHTAPCL